MKESLLLLSLLLLLSCDKDGLRIAIEDSPNADCLKSIFKKDTNFALVKAKKADILVSLDSNLNYKNAKNGNELKYMRQETILGIGYGRVKSILGYEIGACDFAKKHASDLAKLSAAEWKLDSNAKGKMYISIDNRERIGRQSWISLVFVIKKDSAAVWVSGGFIPALEIDGIANLLMRYHDPKRVGLEDVYLNNTIFIYFEDAPSLEYLAQIANGARKAGYSDIVYSPTPLSKNIEMRDVDKAKEMLNSLYYGLLMGINTDKKWYHQDEKWYERELSSIKRASPGYFSSYMVDLIYLAIDNSGMDFIKNNFINILYDSQKHDFLDMFDFEIKSAEPIQIVAKIKDYVKIKDNYRKKKDYRNKKLVDIGEVLFSFEKEYGVLKISDAEAKGVSLRKTLEDRKLGKK